MANPHELAPGAGAMLEKLGTMTEEFLLGRIGEYTHDLPLRSIPGQSVNHLATIKSGEGAVDIKLEKGIEGPDPLYGGAGVIRATEIHIARDGGNSRQIEEVDAVRYYLNGGHKSDPTATYNIKHIKGEANQVTQNGLGLWVVTGCIRKAVAISVR